jgi:hypothetical protein
MHAAASVCEVMHANKVLTNLRKCLLLQCTPQARLPALYLIDSIIKNVKEPYITLFSKRIEHVSCHWHTFH